MYKAFRSRELNYDKHPCLQSNWIASRVYVATGYNGVVVRKVGGEPIGYRGTKTWKKNVVVKPFRVKK